MAEATDRSPLQFKRKAITAFLPYAVWQERNGQPEMLFAIIRAVRASRMPALMWCHACSFAHTLFSRASPRAIVFVSPHIFRYTSYDRERWLQQWAVAVPTVPYTEEVAQSVVDMLLQFASTDLPSRPIIADLWTWLTKRPSLPPICFGRDVGTHRRALRAVWELGDIEILKSYFLLVWSEWNGILSNNPLDTSEWPLTHGISFNCPLSSGTPNTSILFSHSLRMMQMAIWEDFGGVGMGNHRADLVRHLDRVLAKLDLGLRFLEQGNQETNADDLQRRKDQYRILRKTLLESTTRTSHLTIIPLRILTLDGHRIPHKIYVCTPLSVPIVSRPERSTLPLPALFVPPLLYSLL